MTQLKRSSRSSISHYWLPVLRFLPPTTCPACWRLPLLGVWPDLSWLLLRPAPASTMAASMSAPVVAVLAVLLLAAASNVRAGSLRRLAAETTPTLACYQTFVKNSQGADVQVAAVAVQAQSRFNAVQSSVASQGEAACLRALIKWVCSVLWWWWCRPGALLVPGCGLAHHQPDHRRCCCCHPPTPPQQVRTWLQPGALHQGGH